MSDAWRATLYLSAYFFAFGVQLPYLPVWLGEARGLSGAWIAVAVFGALLCRLATGPVITVWAEARTWRSAAVWLSLACAGGYAALWAAPHPALIVLAGFVTLSLVHAIMPLGEAALLQASTDTDAGVGLSFGLGRAIASAVFVGGVLAGGVAVDLWGAASLVPILAGLCVLGAALALLAPKPALGGPETKGPWFRFKAGLRVFRKPGLALLLLAIAPIQSAHAFYYGFSARLWLDQGASGGLTSTLWGVGVITEILLLAFAARLPNWATPERLILAGALGGVLRWSVMGFEPALPLAFGLQLLHGLTFAATYLGTVRIVEREVPSAQRAAAFALQSALAAGAATGLIGLLSGPLYDAVLVKGYWAMAALCGLAAIPAYLMTRRSGPGFPILAR